MYNYKEIQAVIQKARREISAWEEELQQNEKDLLKFYKKGNKRAGVRLRRNLANLIKKAQVLRLDIKRTIKEREIFKGTKFDRKTTKSTPK